LGEESGGLGLIHFLGFPKIFKKKRGITLKRRVGKFGNFHKEWKGWSYLIE